MNSERDAYVDSFWDDEIEYEVAEQLNSEYEDGSHRIWLDATQESLWMDGAAAVPYDEARIWILPNGAGLQKMYVQTVGQYADYYDIHRAILTSPDALADFIDGGCTGPPIQFL